MLSVITVSSSLIAALTDLVVGYVLQSLYRSTTVLVDKQTRPGGFEAERFRAGFFWPHVRSMATIWISTSAGTDKLPCRHFHRPLL